jgi:hypothetical protein
MPVFEFDANQTQRYEPGQPLYPLRHFTDCGYRGHLGVVRSLANSFWVDSLAGDAQFSYSAALLPVTDSLLPWVPLMADLQLPEGTGPLIPIGASESDDARGAQMRRFGLTRPFGKKLAVFAYPVGGAGGVLDENLRQRRTDDIPAVCAEGAAAAMRCCSWQTMGEDDS